MFTHPWHLPDLSHFHFWRLLGDFNHFGVLITGAAAVAARKLWQRIR